MPPTTVILHISDIHFGKAKTEDEKNSKQLVLESLLSTFEKIDSKWKPNVICITGDIAYRAISPEYEHARKWITDLMDKLNLSPEALFLCPGNHDLDRNFADPKEHPVKHEESDGYFNVPLDNSDRLCKPFEAYAQLCKDLSIPPYKCGDIESHIVGGRIFREVNFVSCNSAWFCRKASEDQTKLWIGLKVVRELAAKKQINPLTDDKPSSIVTVALMHHPREWFHRHELQVDSHTRRPATFPFLTRRVELLLTGHTHNPTVDEPTTYHGKCQHFEGGAIYENGTYQNNFRLIRIRFDDPDHPEFEYIPYEYDPNGTRWKKLGTPLRGPINLQSQIREITDDKELAAGSPLLTQALCIADEEAVSTSIDEALDVELKNVVDKMKVGKIYASEELLQSLLEKALSNRASDNSLFRIYNNYGIALLQMGKVDESIEMLNKAAEHAPQSTLPLANLANAYLAGNQLEKSLELCKKAYELAPLDRHVLSVYSRILDRSEKADEILKLMPSAIDENNIDLAIAAAELNYDAGNFQKSVELFTNIESKIKVEDFEPREIFAKALIQSALEDWKKTFEATDSKSVDLADLQARLIKAEQILTELLNHVDGFDLPEARLALATTRGGCRLLLQRWYDAVDDFDRVLRLRADDQQALLNKAQALAALGKYEPALLCLDKVAPSQKSNHLRASTFLAIREFDKAWTAVSQIDENHPLVLSLRWSIAKATGRTNDASEALNKLLINFPDSEETVFTAVQQRYDEGKHDEAISILENALHKANDDKKTHLAENLGSLLQSLGRNQEAIRIYEETNRDDPKIQEKLAIAYYKVGKKKVASELVDDLLARNIRSKDHTLALKVNLCEDIGDYTTAIQFGEESLSIGDQQPLEHLIVLTRLHLILGDQDGALLYANLIRKNQQFLTSPKYVHFLATVYLKFENVEAALQCAYNARKAKFNDADYHLVYIGLFFALSNVQLAPFRKLKVENNCCIVLKAGDGKERVIKIVDDADEDVSKWELGVNHSISKSLIGLKVAESLALDEGAEKTSYEIVNIKHKFEYALQDSAENFKSWFPERDSIIAVPANQSAQLFSDQAKKQAEQIQSSTGMALSKAADSTSSSATFLWLEHFRAGLPTISTKHKTQKQRLSKDSEIVLDISSMLNLNFAGALPAVVKSFTRIKMATHTMADVERALEQLLMSDKRLRYQPIGDLPLNPEDRMKQVEDFWHSISEHAVSPVPSLISEENNRLVETCGTLSAANAILAQDRNAILITDDPLIQTAVEKLQIQHASTQDLLLTLRNAKRFGEQEYRQKVHRLLTARYVYEAFEPEDLEYAWSACNHSFDQPTSFVFQVLRNNEIDLRSRCRKATDFMLGILLSRSN